MGLWGSASRTVGLCVNEALRRFTAEGDLRSRLGRAVAVCDGTKPKYLSLCSKIYLISTFIMEHVTMRNNKDSTNFICRCD